MDKRRALVVLGAVVLATLACGPLGNIGDMVSGSEAGTVAALWPDVPAYPGSQKVDLEMPLVMRLAVEAAAKAVMSEAGDAGGSLEFIAYSTGDSPEEVQGFYTMERMTGEGWADRDDLGCGVSDVEMEDVGAMCAFYKEGSDQDSALFLVAAPGEGGKTSIFYMRIDANPGVMATVEAQ
jgi:hypothetical protein